MGKSKRILFLDFMRVLALLLMIEGHTTYDFLELTVRDGNSVGIQIWTSIRGYTAPFFLMVSGAVFTYLLLSQETNNGTNPRLKAGTRRVITLFFWGYLLNFPIYIVGKIFTPDGWDRFMNMRIGETLLTIIFIGIALYIYNSLQSDDDEKEKERAYIKHLFKRKGYKSDSIILKAKLINKHFIQSETRKRRLYSSFFYSILISIPFLVIASLLSVEEKIQALRSDVLHIIGVGLLTIMLMYYLANKFLPSTIKKIFLGSVFFILMLIAIGLYPLLNKVDFSNLPSFLAAYLNQFGTRSMFTLSPWLAYIFGGGLLGIWLAREMDNGFSEVKVGIKLLLFGFTFIGLSTLGDMFEHYYYGRSYYWYDSPNLVYFRIGTVLLVGAIMSFISIYIKDLPNFLKQMSRNTLWLYVGHLVIIYQFVKPIIGFRTRFSLPIVILFVFIMYFLMYLQTQVIIYVNKNGGYIALFRKWFSKEKEVEE